MKVLSFVSGLILSVCAATAAFAVPTDITVRVIAKDAKFIGTSMGGAQVIVRDADTGELLATGVTAGSTGNTDLIMKKDRVRGVPLSDEKSAKFTATIDIDEPTLIEVTAYGPMGQRQATNKISQTQWVVPGKDITGGDAWLMEIPGFSVDVLAPAAHVKLTEPQEVRIHANVTMMCGCPIKPDDLWDANKYEVKAILKKDGEPAGTVDMHYAGETSQFEGTLTNPEPGAYEATVYAYDPDNGNTGVDKVTFIVAEKKVEKKKE